jgi:alanyl-tRNA synthetase
VVALNGAARRQGLSAAELVRGALSGKGGGSDDLAQGGGLPAEEAPRLLSAVEELVARRVTRPE